MPNLQDAIWFKSEFQPAIERAVAGTPLNVDMITAFACQETGEIWPALRRQGLPTARILELCVGDTLDASPTGGGRRAFPRNRSELVASAGGARMFDVARQGLVDMASYIPGYRGAASRPEKFCHGFGIFQLDLQFFKVDPDYFLEKRYAGFDAALAKCTGELLSVLRRLGWQLKGTLTDLECAAVAIAYNTGRYDSARGLKQGYFDGAKYYGENYFAYLQLAHSAHAPASRGVPVRRKAKKSGARKSVAKSAKTVPSKRIVAKKAVAKTAVRTNAVKKKRAVKKAAKKIVAKRASANKPAAKKPVPKKIAAKKASPRRTSPKKTVRKTAARKAKPR